MSYSEHDVAELLGAYALDAVDPDEARRVEAHLATCPKCRAEVQMYQETAAFLAYAGTDAPEGIWARIGAEIGGENVRRPDTIPDLGAARARRTISWARARGVLVGLATVAAAAITVLGLEVGHLNGQVNALQSDSQANSLVVSALTAQHRNVTLTSVDAKTSATVAITPSGTAYWLGSTLQSLSPARTYQVWGYANGRIVSLGLLGPTPGRLEMFRVQAGVSKLMVTNEPKGGTPAPTTPVLMAGSVPTAL